MLLARFHVICLGSVPAFCSSSFPALESNHGYSEGMGKEVAPPLYQVKKDRKMQGNIRHMDELRKKKKQPKPNKTKNPIKQTPPPISFSRLEQAPFNILLINRTLLYYRKTHLKGE